MRLTISGEFPWARPIAAACPGAAALAWLRTHRLVLAISSALFAWLMLFSWLQPLTEDESVYMVVARGAAEFRWPYHDLFDHKPPLAYFWYLPAGFGAPVLLQRALASLCAVASVPVFAVIARRWLGKERASLATIVYAGLLANTALAVRANLESFTLLPLLAAFAVPSPFAAGVLLGVASMTRAQALLFAPLLVFLWRRDAWKSAAGALLVFCAVSLPFVPIWHDYWTANVTFNIEYGRAPISERLAALFTVPGPIVIGWFWLWLILAIGALRLRDARPWLLAGCGVAAIKLSGLQFDHYYALVAPGAAMLSVPGLIWVWRRPAMRMALGAAVAISLLPVAFGFPDLVRNYDVHHHPLGDAAGVISETRGELYVLGDQGQSYVVTGRQPQRRFFFAMPALIRPGWGEQLRQDLIACPPDILIDSTVNGSLPWHDDITSLYTGRVSSPTGTIYLNPRTPCPHLR